MNTIRELKEQEKYNNMLKRKNKEIERLNNDIKILLKENENKEKVILKYDNIINELEKYLNEQIQKSWEIEEQCYEDIENKLQELKGESSND